MRTDEPKLTLGSYVVKEPKGKKYRHRGDLAEGLEPIIQLGSYPLSGTAGHYTALRKRI